MRDETFTEELPCKLTKREVYQRGREMARTSIELARHEAEAKEQIAELKAKAKELDKEHKRLARIVDSGEENRLVDCYQRAYVDQPNQRFEVETVRIDTGEVVRVRPMDPNERNDALQGTLFEMNSEIMRATKEATERARIEHAEAQAADADDELDELADDEPDHDPETGEVRVVDASPVRPAQRARDAARPAKGGQLASLEEPPSERDVRAPRGSLQNANPLPMPIPPHRDDEE